MLKTKRNLSFFIIRKFNENYDIIDCTDPTHLNDVRVIKDSSIASSFPNGKVGDILISILGIHAVVLLDRDDYHMKWYTIGKTRNQHSPRIVDEGKMLIFVGILSKVMCVSF